jgi:hypothetical protein
VSDLEGAKKRMRTKRKMKRMRPKKKTKNVPQK